MSSKNKIALSYKEKRNILFLKNYKNNNKFRKLCLLSHFDINNKIEKYVIYMIKELYKLKFDIVFVTTAENMKIIELTKISSFIKIAIIKKNIGYDFISWKTGLNVVGEYKKYDQIVTINDSIFFPLFNPKIMFNQMKIRKVDFWGLSDSYRIKYHIQSFFWVFNKKILKSNFFNNFWNRCTTLSDKGMIIREYEVEFTSLVLKNHFKISAYTKVALVYASLEKKLNNLLPIDQYTSFYNFWDTIIEKFKAPFLKKNILIQINSSYNIRTIIWKNVLMSSTKYDVDLISNYLNKTSYVCSKEVINDFNKNILILKDFITLLMTKNKIVLYGYSHIGMLFHSILKERVIDIVDKNYQVLNKRTNFMFNIKSIKYFKKNKHDYIAICSFGRELDVIKSLNKIGVDKKKILTYPIDKNIDIMKFSGNLTKILRIVETINIENNNNNLIIKIYKSKNILIDYLILYSKYKKLNNIDFIENEYISSSNNITFQINNVLDETISDYCFYAF